MLEVRLITVVSFNGNGNSESGFASAHTAYRDRDYVPKIVKPVQAVLLLTLLQYWHPSG
jgi:hypothetical protein